MAGTKKVNFRLAHKSSSKDFSRARRERQIFFVFFGKSEREIGSSGNKKGRTLRKSRDNHVLTPSYWAPVHNQTPSVLVSGSWDGVGVKI